MHWREQKLSTNTAHLACLALPNSSLHLRGKKEEPLLIESLFQPNENIALLYPTDDAQELTPAVAVGLPRPLTLVVPDGSWRQAKKVSLRERSLQHVPRFKIPENGPSNYRLRHSPFKENLCTFEAIARALGVLEGLVVQNALEALFLAMVERKLWSRGKLKPEDCTSQIPEAAFQASYLAGIAGGLRSNPQKQSC